MRRGRCPQGQDHLEWPLGRLRLPPQAARAAGPPGSPTGRSINCAKRTTSPVTIGPLGPPGSGPPARGPQRVSTARVHNAEPLLRPRSSRSSQTSWLLSRRWRRPDTGRRRMAFQVRLTRPISTIAVANPATRGMWGSWFGSRLDVPRVLRQHGAADQGCAPPVTHPRLATPTPARKSHAGHARIIPPIGLELGPCRLPWSLLAVAVPGQGLSASSRHFGSLQAAR
jgi:hypothetical protein